MSNIQGCKYCHQSISKVKRQHNASYCSYVCRMKAQAQGYRARNPRGTIPTGSVGAIGELRVAVDLLNRGDEVFRAVSPCCSCDLAVIRNKRLLRVEVTTGHYTATGTLIHPHQHDKPIHYDIIAIVLPDTIIYETVKPEL